VSQPEHPFKGCVIEHMLVGPPAATPRRSRVRSVSLANESFGNFLFMIASFGTLLQ
jgi:hypothetical protein